MYKTKPCYDLDVLAQQNLHVHTTHSTCAKPEMKVRDILNEAVKDQMKVIAFTDHHHNMDFDILEMNRLLKEQVESERTDIRVLFASELSACGVGIFVDDLEINRSLDYRLYACNHYHLNFWEHPEDRSPRGYVRHELDVLESLFRTDRADCIAHPFFGRFIRCFDDITLVTRAITDQELGDIMTMGKNSQVSWELHVNMCLVDPAFGKRYWDIGKEVGVSFNFGTDAHRLDAVATSPYLERLKAILL